MAGVKGGGKKGRQKGMADNIERDGGGIGRRIRASCTNTLWWVKVEK